MYLLFLNSFYRVARNGAKRLPMAPNVGREMAQTGCFSQLSRRPKCFLTLNLQRWLTRWVRISDVAFSADWCFFGFSQADSRSPAAHTRPLHLSGESARDRMILVVRFRYSPSIPVESGN